MGNIQERFTNLQLKIKEGGLAGVDNETRELLVKKGFKTYGGNCFTKILRGMELQQYFNTDMNNLKKVLKGQINEIKLYIYPEMRIVEWRMRCNYHCIEDDFNRAMNYVKRLRVCR